MECAVIYIAVLLSGKDEEDYTHIWLIASCFKQFDGNLDQI